MTTKQPLTKGRVFALIVIAVGCMALLYRLLPSSSGVDSAILPQAPAALETVNVVDSAAIPVSNTQPGEPDIVPYSSIVTSADTQELLRLSKATLLNSFRAREAESQASFIAAVNKMQPAVSTPKSEPSYAGGFLGLPPESVEVPVKKELSDFEKITVSAVMEVGNHKKAFITYGQGLIPVVSGNQVGDFKVVSVGANFVILRKGDAERTVFVAGRK